MTEREPVSRIRLAEHLRTVLQEAKWLHDHLAQEWSLQRIEPQDDRLEEARRVLALYDAEL